MIAIRTVDSATPALRAMIARAGGAPGLKVAARGLANVARAHFDERDRTNPNRLGGKRTHFWRQVRRSVQAPVVRGSEGIVGINHVGIGQKVKGGVIRPVRRKFLTIPARTEAYGRTAREFNNLTVAYNSRGPYALVETLVTRIRLGRVSPKTGKRGGVKAAGESGGAVMFWLVDRVKQAPDAKALPSFAALANGAMESLLDYLAAQASMR